MTLVEKQGKFTEFMSKFTLALIAKGYTVTDSEAYRPLETALLYEKQGRGVANSLHCLRLARDINLFHGDQREVSFNGYLEAGELWESYSTQDFTCCWGGRFLRQDVMHFSFSHRGVK
jgi:hypothetical protein